MDGVELMSLKELADAFAGAIVLAILTPVIIVGNFMRPLHGDLIY